MVRCDCQNSNIHICLKTAFTWLRHGNLWRETGSAKFGYKHVPVRCDVTVSYVSIKAIVAKAKSNLIIIYIASQLYIMLYNSDLCLLVQQSLIHLFHLPVSVSVPEWFVIIHTNTPNVTSFSTYDYPNSILITLPHYLICISPLSYLPPRHMIP